MKNNIMQQILIWAHERKVPQEAFAKMPQEEFEAFLKEKSCFVFIQSKGRTDFFSIHKQFTYAHYVSPSENIS